MSSLTALAWSMRGVGACAVIAELEWISARRWFAGGGPLGPELELRHFPDRLRGRTRRPASSVLTWCLAAAVISAGAVLLASPTWAWVDLAALIVVVLGFGARLMSIAYGHDGSDQMVPAVALCAIGGIAAEQADMSSSVGLIAISTLLTTTYLVAGLSKVRSPSWRSGHAIVAIVGSKEFGNERLARVLAFHPALPVALAWWVMVWEISLGVALLADQFLIAWLVIGVAGHVSIAVIMGLNRFVPVFLGCYPAFAYVGYHTI